jgi:flagellar basal body P-ring formation protein FlgA
MTHKNTVLLALGFCAAPSLAAPAEDLDALDRRIADVLGAPIGTPGGAESAIDKRLVFPACAERVTIARIDVSAVAVRCAAQNWRVRVPIVPKATPEPQGNPVRASTNDMLVRRGDMVVAHYEADDFDISSQMMAMEDGRKGDHVRVKNPDNGHHTLAIVSREGVVALIR